MRDSAAASVPSALRRSRERWSAAYAGLWAIAVVAAVVAVRAQAPARPVALTALALAGVAVLVRPILGVHLTVFFGLLGDSYLSWWYPFAKNLSSHESVLFVHDAAVFSPLELFLGLTFAAWCLHLLGGRPPVLRRGPLLWPLAAFSAFVALGLVHGLARGGNTVVALWEVRPLLYLPAVYLLATQLFTARRHYDSLLWTAMAALTLEALHATYVMTTLTGAAVVHAEARGWLEHSSSLHVNTVFVLLAASWLLRGASWPKRAVPPAMAAVVLTPYLVAERRSAVVALAAAALLLAVVLARVNRRLFWVVVPVTTLIAMGYLAVFWNGDGALAFPAQAVKSVLAPETLGAEDLSSNQYRQVETYNVVETVRSSPVLGLGFGHPFHQPIPLPYLAFAWAEYLPHNAMLWIWINAGVGGFVALLYLLARAIRTGAGGIVRLGPGDDAVVMTTAVTFVVMYAIYAYVDIAWDTQSMLYLGVALAVIDHLEDLPARTPRPRKADAAVGSDPHTRASTLLGMAA